MAQFFATTAKGVIDPLKAELTHLGFTNLEATASGVMFESNWRGCYKANLESRLASRILKPLLDFPAYQPEDLYNNILKHDFTKYISPDQTLAVDASVKECMLADQRFVALKVKDAIVDQFREKFQVRPNVERENPDLRIWIRGYKNRFHVSLDTSGAALNQRGYRKEAGEAPMKENLAAALIKMTGWDEKTPIVDPMCGSGTLLIEAAMMLKKVAPGGMRTRFGFQKLKNFDSAEWESVVDEAMNHELQDETPSEVPLLYGYDIDRKVIQMAKFNAKRAGVDHLIHFQHTPIATLQAPVPFGMIVTNPPYAIRMGDEALLHDVYKDLGFTLRSQFAGWSAWILSGNRELMADLKLKASRKIFVYNGAIECRFLKYDIRKVQQ